MEIELYCKQCNSIQNGHWHKGVDIMNPKCPVCKSIEVYTWTDETLDYESVNVEYGDDDE